MQIGEPMLQLLLYKKAQNEQNKIIPEKDTLPEAAQAGSGNSSAAIVTSEDYKIANDFAMNNLDEKQRIAAAASDTVVINTHAVTLSSLSDAEISKIKQVIYDLHHPKTTPTEPDTPTPTPTPSAGQIGFMNDFSSVDEMFDYINTIDSSVTKDTGLDSNALWQLTQRDDWEENNNNFFGILNHGFDLVDTNGDGTLSYDEISNFIGDEMSTADEYLAKVEQYSNELQRDFASMTSTQKLNFAIDRAKEYFQQVGLTEQLQALNRLIAENKLGFMDLNPGKDYNTYTGGWVLGAYMSLQYEDGSWADDPLTYPGEPDYHGGIWLDEYYYCERSDATWYDLVGTLIHEVTHATAFLHANDETAWGEYVAYQVEEDYLDSIACGQWSGSAEKNSITNHIDTYYNDATYTEPVPTGKWWTYGDYA